MTILILTNLTDAPSTADALTHGVHDILVKSDWKLADVIAKVRERIGEG